MRDSLFRNFLADPGFRYAQMSPGAAVTLTTTPSYLVSDMWRVSYSGTITGTPQANRVAQSPTSATKYASQLSVRRNASSVTLRWAQRMEGDQASDLLIAGVASFAFRTFVTTITGAQARLTLNYATALNNFTAVTQIYTNTLSGTLTPDAWGRVAWENVTLPSNVTNGLEVVLEVILPSGTDGANVNHWMTQAVCVPGKTAPADFVPFARNPQHELAYVQRFLQKSYELETAPGTATSTGATFMANVYNNSQCHSEPLKVQMISIPTLTVYNPSTGSSGSLIVNGSNATHSPSGNNSTRSIKVDYSGVASSAYANYHYVADARL